MVMTDRKLRWICTAAFVLSMVVLLGAAPGKPPEPPRLRQAFPPAFLKDDTYTSPSGDFDFSRVRRGDDWLVNYRFRGLAKEHEVSCRINVRDGQKLIDGFSYRQSDKAAAIAKLVEEEARNEKGFLMSLGEPSFVGVFDEREDEIRITYTWNLKNDSLTTAYQEPYARDDERAFFEWHEKNKKDLYARAEAKFMVPRGFVFERRQGGWIIDYARLVERGATVLRNCVEAFGQEAGKDPEVLMNFFQAMPWVLIEDKNTAWVTGGVRVPSSVMLQVAGDCDSKAVAFCVLHRDHAPGLVIFRSFRKRGDKRPGHALVGVETYTSRAKWPVGKAWPVHPLEAVFYKDPVIVADRYFVPCEVAGGGGRLPYGQVGQRQDARRTVYRDDYVAIPIPVPGKAR